jgi:hypothetical protein
MMNPELTLDHLNMLEGTRRVSKAYSQLNLDLMGRLLIGAAMATEPNQPWAVAPLALYVHHPRTSVRRRLDAAKEIGLVMCCGKDRGVVLSPMGRRLLTQIVQETSEIVTGNRIGFSGELINMIERLPKPSSGIHFQIGEEARTLSFPPFPTRKTR